MIKFKLILKGELEFPQEWGRERKTGMNFEKHCTKYKNKDGQDQVRAQAKGGERLCTQGTYTGGSDLKPAA